MSGHRGAMRLTGSGKTARLPTDMQAKLDAIIRRRGIGGASAETGIAAHTLERLAHGGYSTPRAVETATRKLMGS